MFREQKRSRFGNDGCFGDIWGLNNDPYWSLGFLYVTLFKISHKSMLAVADSTLNGFGVQRS